MNFDLFPFQQIAIKKQLDFLHHSPTNSVYNACEQGLGKTVQTCAIIECLKPKKTLIICPAVMRLTWEAEINKFCKIKYDIGIILSATSQIKPSNDIVIISYNLCDHFLSQILWHDWEMLVLDESHYVKSLKAKRTKVILKELWPRFKYKIALSGTPLTNNVVDGFSLFNRMAPQYFPRFSDFAGEYSYKRITPWGVKYFGIRNPDKLKKIIRDNFFIRYTKEEVMPELPEKIFQKIILPESLAIKAPKTDIEKLEQAISSLKCLIENDELGGKILHTMLLQTQKRLQGEKKVPLVVDFVKNLLNENQSVVLFGYHTNVIKTYIEELKKYNPQVITGETSARLRQEAVERFQWGETNLFIGQMVASGVGITLLQKDKVTSPNVVFGEFDWNPATIAQAIDRCHRIGTKSAVNIYYFVVKNSIDEDLIETVMTKVKDFAKVIEN